MGAAQTLIKPYRRNWGIRRLPPRESRGGSQKERKAAGNTVTAGKQTWRGCAENDGGPDRAEDRHKWRISPAKSFAATKKTGTIAPGIQQSKAFYKPEKTMTAEKGQGG
jgi:hypothetical protein